MAGSTAVGEAGAFKYILSYIYFSDYTTPQVNSNVILCNMIYENSYLHKSKAQEI